MHRQQAFSLSEFQWRPFVLLEVVIAIIPLCPSYFIRHTAYCCGLQSPIFAYASRRRSVGQWSMSTVVSWFFVIIISSFLLCLASLFKYCTVVPCSAVWYTYSTVSTRVPVVCFYVPILRFWRVTHNSNTASTTERKEFRAIVKKTVRVVKAIYQWHMKTVPFCFINLKFYSFVQLSFFVHILNFLSEC